jgi:hypothetical protein
LAEKIMVLLADKELREAMTVHNRLLAQQFTASRVAEEYIAAYKSIISKDKG